MIHFNNTYRCSELNCYETNALRCGRKNRGERTVVKEPWCESRGKRTVVKEPWCKNRGKRTVV